MFGDNSFGDIEDLFSQLARQMGHSGQERSEYNDASNILLSSIENKNEGIFIFDFSGKKVKSVEIKDAPGINEYGERVHNGNRVIEIIYDESEVLKYVLPTKFKRRDRKSVV